MKPILAWARRHAGGGIVAAILAIAVATIFGHHFGGLRVHGELHAGENSIILGPAGVGDVIQWSAAGGPATIQQASTSNAAAGDMMLAAQRSTNANPSNGNVDLSVGLNSGSGTRSAFQFFEGGTLSGGSLSSGQLGAWIGGNPGGGNNWFFCLGGALTRSSCTTTDMAIYSDGSSQTVINGAGVLEFGTSGGVSWEMGGGSGVNFFPNHDNQGEVGDSGFRVGTINAVNGSFSKMGGSSANNVPFQWQSSSIVLTTGTTTLSAAQYATPLINLTGSLTGANTLVWPNQQAEWYVDTTGVTFGAQTITLECGSASKTTTLTSGSTVGLWTMYCNGANKFYEAIRAQ